MEGSCPVEGAMRVMEQRLALEDAARQRISASVFARAESNADVSPRPT